MTIDEAIAHARDAAKQGCSEYHEEYGQIADWPEQLVNQRYCKSDYIRRGDAAKVFIDWAAKRDIFGSLEYGEALERIPAEDVRSVKEIIDRLDMERKKARGRWHTDPYWLGWVDAMGRAQRIVDGTIDDEPMYAPSNGEKREGEK